MDARATEPGEWAPTTTETLDPPDSFHRDDFKLPEHASDRLLVVKNAHPRDARIRFDPVPHEYWVDGIRTAGSVTGIAKRFAQEFVKKERIDRMRHGKEWPREQYMTREPAAFVEAARLVEADLLSMFGIDDVGDGTLAEVSVVRELLAACRSDAVDATRVADLMQTLANGRLRDVVRRAVRRVELSPERIEEIWDLNGAEKANRGTWMHLLCELVLNREPIPAAEVETLEMTAFFKYTREILIEQLGVEPYRTEWEIFAEGENVAGSIDFVGRKRSDGKLVLVDWKRTKELEDKMTSDPRWPKYMSGPLSHLHDAKGVHYELQLNIYRWIIERYYGLLVDGMQVVSFHPDRSGDAFVHEVPVMTEEVEHLMTDQRARHAESIRARAEAQRKRKRRCEQGASEDAAAYDD